MKTSISSFITRSSSPRLLYLLLFLFQKSAWTTLLEDERHQPLVGPLYDIVQIMLARITVFGGKFSSSHLRIVCRLGHNVKVPDSHFQVWVQYTLLSSFGKPVWSTHVNYLLFQLTLACLWGCREGYNRIPYRNPCVLRRWVSSVTLFRNIVEEI